MLTFGAILDRITPHLGKVAILSILAITGVILLNMVSCSRQEAAQSKQEARSAQAGTKTAKQGLERVIERHSTETHTREVITQGQKDLDNEADYRGFRGDVRATACSVPNVGYDTACQLP